MAGVAGSGRRCSGFRRGLRAGVVSVMLAAVAVVVAVVAPPASAATSYTNPIKSQKGADPWIAYHDGDYYLVSTTFTNTLVMRKSATLAGLSTAPSVQVWQDTTPARGTNIWAPEIHMFNGRWYLYYSAAQVGAACCDTQRTHVLESAGSDPLGPYTYRNILTGSNLKPDGWLIDASVLQVGGRLYLMGSGFIGDSGQSLVIAPMSNPYTLSSSTFSVISRPTLSWETVGSGVNEGPVALHRNGRTMIVYSASSCQTADYQLGLLTLTGDDPMSASSWTKSPNPVFRRDDANGVYGAGHNGFFKSPDGAEDWIVYHANSSADGGCGNGRTTRAQKFTWNDDDTPNFGTPVGTGVSLPAPAGETAATPTAYTVVNRHSGKCLDLADGSSADGANVRQWACDGSTAQQWRFEDQGDDTSRIVNVASGKVLDVANCNKADGTDIRQWSWLNNVCQRFRAITTDSGWVRLQNEATGKVAGIADCGTTDGTDVRQWTWQETTCQQWSLNPPDLDDATTVRRAVARVSIKNLDDVRGNLRLPTTSEGVTLDWASSKPAVIAATGDVKRPAAGSQPATVTLTVTGRKGTATATRDLIATVTAMPAAHDPFGYLMVHFVEDSNGYKEKIYLSLSRGENPTSWSRLNGGEPILASDKGTTGIRDPYLIRSPEGDKFYIIATDLRVFGGDNAGWGAWTRKGSRSLLVWESTDLVHWSDIRSVEVAPATAGMAWAPEAVYDETTGEYVVFWASTMFAESDPEHTGATYSRILYAKTRDFVTFSPAKVLIDTGGDTIDTTMIRAAGKVFRFNKDNGPADRDLYGEVGSSIFADDFKTTQLNIGRAQYGSVEGPLVFKDSYADKWYLYVDQYGGAQQGYRPFVSTNMAAGNWAPLGGSFDLPANTKHGAVIALRGDEWERLAGVRTTGIDLVRAQTTVGTAPTLPADVTVRLSDGTTQQRKVTWHPIDPADINRPGTVQVTGDVIGTSVKAQATVQVANSPAPEPLAVTSVDPASVASGSIRTITLNGKSLDARDTVEVTPAGDSPLAATVKGVSADGTTMTAEVNLTSASPGRASVTVRPYGADRKPVTLRDAFTITAPALKPTTLPKITGSVAVGGIVKATAGTWNPAATSYAYQWEANGKAIRGATRASYTIAAAVLGKKLTVRVTANRAGYPSGSATSAPTAPVAKGPAPNAKTKPKIIGKAKVGRTVRATTGTWSPKADSYRYEWRLNGVVIRGATSAKLRLTASMRNKRLTVTVIATKAGHAGGKATSTSVTVRR